VRLYVQPRVFAHATFPVRQLTRYALPLLLMSLSMRLYERMDLFLIQRLTGDAAIAGIYGAAQNVSLVFGIFAMSFTPTLISVLVRTQRTGGIEPAKQLAQNALRLVLIILVFTAALAGAGREIALFAFGQAFASSGTPLGMLAFAGCCTLMISVATAVLVAAGKPGWTAALTLYLPPLLAVALLLVIPRYGVLGASITVAAIAALGAATSLIAVRILLQVAPPYATFGRTLVLGPTAYVAAALWELPDGLVVFKLALIAIAIALGFWAMGEITKGDSRFIRNLLSARPSRGDHEEKKRATAG
jgi:O-antigen/teichoic acid export membrane protein